MPKSSGHVLKIQQFRLRYPNSMYWILDGLDMSISAGECLALVGSSGCGKSSVARAIIQLLPDGSVCEGDLILAGKETGQLDQMGLRRLRGELAGFVFQDPMTRLNPLMTAGAHLLDLLRAHRPGKTSSWRESRAKELLQKVGISSKRFGAFPHELSGGMRQRLVIALAIALEPPLIIADEPTTSLDVAVANQVMGQLRSLCDDLGSSLLLITHDLALAARWCEKISILDCGQIVESGLSKEILLNPQSSIGRRLVSSACAREGGIKSLPSKDRLILQVNSLRCWHQSSSEFFGNNWIKAVDGVSFTLQFGESLGIVGSSGCGKSTLCRAIMGLAPIRGGQVILQGKNIVDLHQDDFKATMKAMQMVFQDPLACLNPRMKIGEAIADALLIHKICTKTETRQISRDLLKQVGLTPPELYQQRYPSQLSGGQQQRVVIARALALNPKLLICDESISMLDAETQSEILSLLRDLQKRLGLAILLITHDLSIASGFCHRIIVLDHGKIVEEGLGEKLFNAPNSQITRRLVEACPILPRK